jgi:hypothetical protein
MQGVKILGQKNFFAIKKGVIYQYEKTTSREALDKIPILKIKTIDINKADPKSFNFIYK